MNPWFPSFRRSHTKAVVILLAIALLLFPLLPPVSLLFQLIILAMAVMVFGLPHGALDLALVHGATRGSRSALVVAVFVYVIVGLAVLALWLVAPVAALLLFLLIAVIHFGLGDSEDLKGPQRALEVVARGGFAVIAPLVFHPDITRGLFALLVGPDSTIELNRILAAITPGLGWFWAACLIFAVVWRIIQRSEGSIIATFELILTCAVFAVFHPLGAFLIYFCFVHSIRHITDLGAARSPDSAKYACRWIVTESIPLTVVTLILAGTAWLFFASHVPIDEILIRMIFWGLSALTVPHMILTAWWHAQSDPKPGDLFSPIFMTSLGK